MTMRKRVTHILFLNVLLLLPFSLRAESAQDAFLKIHDELLVAAKEKAPSLIIAQKKLNASKAHSWTAFANWTPRVDLLLSENKNESSLSWWPTGPYEIEERYRRWNFRLEFPIYQRSIHQNFMIQKQNEKLSTWQLKEEEIRFLAQWHSLIEQYLFQTYKENTLGASIGRAQIEHQEVTTNFKLGRKNRIDLLHSEANLSALQAKKLQVSSEIDRAFRELIEFSGESEEELGKLKNFFKDISNDDHLALISKYTDIENQYKIIEPIIRRETDLNQTILIQNKRQEKDLNLQKLKLIVQDQWPSLSLQADIGKKGSSWNDSLSSSRGEDERSIALVLKIPLFSGGSLISELKEYSNSKIALETKFRSETDEIKSRVSQECDQVKILKARLDALDLARKRYDEIYLLSIQSYNLGRLSIQDVLSAQDELINSKIDVAKTKIELSSLIKKLLWELEDFSQKDV